MNGGINYKSNVFVVKVSCTGSGLPSSISVPNKIIDMPATAQGSGVDTTILDFSSVITSGASCLNYKIKVAADNSDYAGSFVAFVSSVLKMDSDVIDNQNLYVEVYESTTLIKTTNTFQAQTKCGSTSNFLVISSGTNLWQF